MNAQPELPLDPPDLSEHRAAVVALLRDAKRIAADGPTAMAALTTATGAARSAAEAIVAACLTGGEEDVLDRAIQYAATPF